MPQQRILTPESTESNWATCSSGKKEAARNGNCGPETSHEFQCQNLRQTFVYTTYPYTTAMDSLIARADAIQPYKKRKTSHVPAKSGPSKPTKSDQTSNSVAKHTKVPKSLQDTHDLPEDGYKHIANKKLRTHLNRQSAQGARAQALVEDAEMLLMDDAGGMQVESEMDRTWRVGQTEIVQSSGQEAAKGRREYKLDSGPYRSRYTRNGRYVPFDLEKSNLIIFLDILL